MARIQITLPDSFTFSTNVPLYTHHINWAGHLDNALLLTVVSEARVRYFKSMGYSEANVEGHGIIITDAAVQYLAEGFYGDVMRVDMAFVEPNKYGGDLVWRMACQADGREIARGKTGFILFDYSCKKPALLPVAFLKKAMSLPHED